MRLGEGLDRPGVPLGAAVQRDEGILQGGEVQEGGDRLLRRREQGVARVARDREEALIDRLVAVADLVLFVGQELLDLVPIGVHRVGEIDEVVGQDVRVGEPHEHRPGRLRQGPGVDELGVREAGVPEEIVIDRVINALLVLAPEPEVERRDPQVIEERRVVAPRPQCGDAEVGPRADFLDHVGGARGPAEGLQAMGQGDVRLGVEDVPGHAVREFLQGMRPAHAEEPPAVAVRVHVDRGMGDQVGGVLLAPFRRPEEPRLLAVPGAEEDRPPGLPSLLEELGEGAGLLQERDQAGDGVVGAVDPGVVVVASDDPLVGRARSGDRGDDVADGLDVPVRLDLQMDLRGAGADVVGDRQAAAEVFRDGRAFQLGQQGLRVPVRDGEDRDLRDRWRLLDREAPGIPLRGDSGRQGVAGIQRHVGHAASLDAVLIAHRALREDVIDDVAVIRGVGIDQATDRAMLRGHLHLDPSPRLAVTGDHDRPLHRDAQAVQGLVILRDAIVHIDERCGHVAVDGIGVVGRELLGLLIRGRVLRDGRLLELRDEADRLDELEDPGLRGRKKHVVLLNLRVESPGLESLQNPFGVVPVVGRADMMRAGAQPLHGVSHDLGAGDRPEFLLPGAFGLRRRGREAVKGCVVRRPRKGNRGGEDQGRDRKGSAHRISRRRVLRKGFTRRRSIARVTRSSKADPWTGQGPADRPGRTMRMREPEPRTSSSARRRDFEGPESSHPGPVPPPNRPGHGPRFPEGCLTGFEPAIPRSTISSQPTPTEA